MTNKLEKQICQELITSLALSDIKAKVFSKPIVTLKLRRFYVISKCFKNIDPSERQEIIWRIVKHKFTFEEFMLISIFYILTPKEFKEYGL